MAEHVSSAPGAHKNKKQGGRLLPAFCSLLGTLLILAVIAVALPLSLPPFFGYEVYEVMSGSMEPEIPIGSVIYVAQAAPEELQTGDIITFVSEGVPVTHRVVRNRLLEGELVTKGDANPIEDIDPVPYAMVIGKVEHHYPMLGHVMSIYSSTMGKVYLLMIAACGVLFNILAGRMRDRRRAAEAPRAADPGREEPPAETAAHAAPRRRRGMIFRRVLMIVLAAVFLSSAGYVLYVMHGYKENDAIYSAASDRFTKKTEAASAAQSEGEEDKAKTGGDSPRIREGAPILVDFDALRAVNSDVEGWIYCPGTVINYPVAHTDNDDYYLHHSYDGKYSAFGTIFADSENSCDFTDVSTIIYGHHMRNGSMFATLEDWGDQAYYESHPVMYLLTPERDYKIILMSGYAVSAYSDTYTIFKESDDAFREFMEEALAKSEFDSGAQFDENGRYVMLSTCAYVFSNARYVIHGQLVPLDTAGGEWIE